MEMPSPSCAAGFGSIAMLMGSDEWFWRTERPPTSTMLRGDERGNEERCDDQRQAEAAGSPSSPAAGMRRRLRASDDSSGPGVRQRTARPTEDAADDHRLASWLTASTLSGVEPGATVSSPGSRFP